MITLGEKGAMMATSGKVFFVSPAEIKVLSTIGAGDSSIGGFLYAIYNGKDASECLKTAVAFGSAACMTRGTKPPSKEDIEKIIGEITVHKRY